MRTCYISLQWVIKSWPSGCLPPRMLNTYLLIFLSDPARYTRCLISGFRCPSVRQSHMCNVHVTRSVPTFEEKKTCVVKCLILTLADTFDKCRPATDFFLKLSENRHCVFEKLEQTFPLDSKVWSTSKRTLKRPQLLHSIYLRSHGRNHLRILRYRIFKKMKITSRSK